jgi:hypothetical protein
VVGAKGIVKGDLGVLGGICDKLNVNKFINWRGNMIDLGVY